MRSEGGQTQPSSFGSLINLFLLLADCCKGLLSPSVFHGTLAEVTASISLLCIKECSSTWNWRFLKWFRFDHLVQTLMGGSEKEFFFGRNNPWCFHVHRFEEGANGWPYGLHVMKLLSFWGALHIRQRKEWPKKMKLQWRSFSHSALINFVLDTHSVLYFRHYFLAFSFLLLL